MTGSFTKNIPRDLFHQDPAKLHYFLCSQQLQYTCLLSVDLHQGKKRNSILGGAMGEQGKNKDVNSPERTETQMEN